MRKLALVVALVLGFFVVAGRPGDGFRVVGVAAASTLSGFTLTLSEYVIAGLLDTADGDRLVRDRRKFELVDWTGRLVGFSLLGWIAWRRFGKAKVES